MTQLRHDQIRVIERADIIAPEEPLFMRLCVIDAVTALTWLILIAHKFNGPGAPVTEVDQ